MEYSSTRRRRGEGGVYNRRGIWWLNYRLAGERIRESSGSQDRSVAESMLDARIRAKDDNHHKDRLYAEILPEEMHEKLKARAIAQSCSVTWLIEEILSFVVNEGGTENGTPVARISPPDGE